MLPILTFNLFFWWNSIGISRMFPENAKHMKALWIFAEFVAKFYEKSLDFPKPNKLLDITSIHY